MAKIKARDKEYQRKIARERVEILLERARKTEDEELARRYVKLAVRIARKHRIRLGKLKYTFCRRCYTPWNAETVKVRLIHDPYPAVIYRCLQCGAEYRIPIVREKKLRRKKVRNGNP